MAKSGGGKGGKNNEWIKTLVAASILAAFKAAVDWVREHLPEIKDFFSHLGKKAIKWWNGKKVAVIGPPAVGKDSLFHRLKREPLPEKPHSTKGAEKQKPFHFKRTLPNGKTFSVMFKRCINVGGEKEQTRHWMEACRESDVIFFMMTIDDLRDSKYLPGNRIHGDLKWLAANMGDMKPNTVVHILVNKIDLALADGKGYELLIKQVEPQVTELQNTAQSLFGDYATRLTGMSLTSMKDDYLFGVTFLLALERVYRALHDEA